MTSSHRPASLLALTIALSCGEAPPLDCPDGARVSGTREDGLACVDVDGTRVGPFRRWGSAGNLVQQGQYDEKGRQTGAWTTFHDSGRRERVETWQSGFMNGPWAEWDDLGRKTR